MPPELYIVALFYQTECLFPLYPPSQYALQQLNYDGAGGPLLYRGQGGLSHNNLVGGHAYRAPPNPATIVGGQRELCISIIETSACTGPPTR